jgi:hypothetical protein
LLNIRDKKRLAAKEKNDSGHGKTQKPALLYPATELALAITISASSPWLLLCGTFLRGLSGSAHQVFPDTRPPIYRVKYS